MNRQLGSYGRASRVLAQRFWFASVAPAFVRRLGEVVFRRLGRRNATAPLDLAKVERLLVVRLDKIGDVVLSSSFFRELRRNAPQARITVVVSPAGHAVIAGCPYVDEVQCYDWRRARALGPLHDLHAVAKAARDLWPYNFDLAIVPCWGVDYYLASLLAYLSGARWRVGYSECVTSDKQQLNRGFDRFFTHASTERGVKHEVERNLDLLRFIGGIVEHDELEVWPSETDRADATRLLRDHGFRPGEFIVALAPGAGAPKRQWPVENFAALASWLAGVHGAGIVVLGGRGEEALGRAVAQDLGDRALDLTGQTTLLQTAAVLEHCGLFVGNDSGPMHLATATGTPTVDISCHPRDGAPLHENSPDRFGPWGKDHSVIRPELAVSPCNGACSAVQSHCIRGVSLEQVQSVVAGYLVARPSAHPTVAPAPWSAPDAVC